MDDDVTHRVLKLPEFALLLKTRRSINMTLISIMLLGYFGFILGLAYFPAILSTRLGSGVTTLGIVVALALIVLTIAITGIFIHLTEKKSDVLVAAIRKKANGEQP